MDSDQKRFWNKVNKTDSCWDWTGSTQYGYGRFSLNGRSLLAHRVSYTWLRGQIPDHLVVDHLCRNRGCVNPEHMELVTPKVNKQRQHPNNGQASKTHCPQLHPYDAVNTYLRPGGGRGCNICRRAAVQKQRICKVVV